MTFKELGLSDRILTAVEEAGYKEPTPIQAQAIPPALRGRDILGIAQTGTGKTASFVLPMIDRLEKGRARARMPRSLILAPTRELAAQVADAFKTYGQKHKLSMALLIGGVSFAEQEKLLDRGVDVLIATPGRLIDHFERGKCLLTGVEILVIDEADRMLDMGFIPDVERIVGLLPFTRQTLFFSATMQPEITRLTEAFLQNPERVEVARQATTAETVSQHLVYVHSDDKREALRQLIRDNDVKNGIIFCNRKRDVSIVFRSLIKHEFSAGALHGDLDQRVRMQTLDAFRSGEIKLLVASDVAARGLDIPEVSHVFNFDVPFNSEDYVHRIGRTGRAGREGASFTLSAPNEKKYVTAIEELIERTIPVVEIDGLTSKKDDDEDSRPRRKQSKSRHKEDSDGRRGEKPRGSRRGDRRGGKSDRRDREPDKPVVGMGDHVPAFMSIPLPKRKSKEIVEEGVSESATG